MKRLMVGVLLMILAANVSAQRRSGSGRQSQTPDPAAGEALSGLTASQRADFADGLGDFTEVESVADGLGPVFNERSCAACHSVPAIGGGSNRLVTRFATRVNGLFDTLASLGGSLVRITPSGRRTASRTTSAPRSCPRPRRSPFDGGPRLSSGWASSTPRPTPTSSPRRRSRRAAAA